jgi:hypothetical protein
MISIKLEKGDDIALRAKLPELEIQARSAGITLSKDGKFAGKGLEGKFFIKPDYVEVIVDKKPWGVFDWMIKDKLESLIADVLV